MNLLVKGLGVSTIFVILTHLLTPHYDFNMTWDDLLVVVVMLFVMFVLCCIEISTSCLNKICTLSIAGMCLIYLITYFYDTHAKPSSMEDLFIFAILCLYVYHQQLIDVDETVS